MRIISVYRAVSTRFKKQDEESCRYCGSSVDDAEHTLSVCGRWGEAKRAACQALGSELASDTMVPVMHHSEESWKHIESFITQVMRTKNLDGRKK